MPHPRLKIDVIFDKRGNAEKMVTRASEFLVSLNMFDIKVNAVNVMANGKIEFLFDARFNVKAERDAFTVALVTYVSRNPVNNWIESGQIETHMCTHSESDFQPCVSTIHWSK